MEVATIILTTVVVFVVVDLLLRMVLTKVREARTRRERESALDTGLALDVSAEAPSLKRVSLEHPKARILAVDDETVILDGFRKMLVLGGYSIDTVENGSEALGLIRKRDYDFVFTDLKMPGMDGVEVTRAVRRLRPDIDVIVITGYATIETAVETVQSGAMDYVQKPFTEDELLGVVKTALIKRRDRQQRQRRHTIRLVRPGTGESKSRFELNVPAGVFASPQHAWAKIELNGTVRVGPDDLVRKLFGRADRIGLPEPGQKIDRGKPLFSIFYGNFSLDIPAPVSGTVCDVNQEHVEHPEWLAIKPFELSWMCAIEPSNLAADLAGLKIGTDAIDWYQSELDRYGELAARLGRETAAEGVEDTRRSGREAQAADPRLLAQFSEPFLRC